jgi:signal transduction histidine kinase
MKKLKDPGGKRESGRAARGTGKGAAAKQTKAAVRESAGSGEQAILAAIDAEQQRLAQALHDTVCQSLTGMNILAGLIARKLKALSPEIAGEVAELRDLIGQTSDEVHEMVRWLRPPALAGDGLTFRPYRSWPAAFRSGSHVSWMLLMERSRWIPYVSAQIYHIVQTAVQHSLCRAGVGKITMSLALNPGEIVIAIEDDAPVSEDGADQTAKAMLAWQVADRRAAAIGATISRLMPCTTGNRVECRAPLSPS